MKKKIVTIFAAIMAVSIFMAAAPVYADYAPPVISDEYNLAINEYNWHKPTVSTAKVDFSEQGIEFSNMTKDQNGPIYYRGDSLGEFRMDMLIDANLNVAQEGAGAEWRYSNVYITFLVDRNPENAIAEWAVPWNTNRAYMSLQIGLDAFGTPLCTFVRYNAFANNAYAYNYVGTSTDTNIADGNEHYLQLEVKNFSEEIDGKTLTGKDMVCYIDGAVAASFRYLDDTYYDSTTQREYDVEISKIKGGFGIYTSSDWPAGTAPSKMNNTFTIKKLQVTSFDDNAEGTLLPQLEEPFFPVEAVDYVTQPSYEAGELIEIKLEDLFTYEGTQPLEYAVTIEGKAIGAISNGFWSWTPQEAGTYYVDFSCKTDEDNSAVNFLTLRVAEAEQPTTTPGGNDKSEKGCKSSVSVSVLGALFAGIGLLAVKQRKSK